MLRSLNRIACFSLAFLVLATGCGEQSSSLDREIDQIWLSIAATAEPFELCTTFDDESTRTSLELMLVDEFGLAIDEVPVAVAAIEQRCENLTG